MSVTVEVISIRVPDARPVDVAPVVRDWDEQAGHLFEIRGEEADTIVILDPATTADLVSLLVYRLRAFGETLATLHTRNAQRPGNEGVEEWGLDFGLFDDDAP